MAKIYIILDVGDGQFRHIIKRHTVELSTVKPGWFGSASFLHETLSDLCTALARNLDYADKTGLIPMDGTEEERPLTVKEREALNPLKCMCEGCCTAVEHDAQQEIKFGGSD